MEDENVCQNHSTVMRYMLTLSTVADGLRNNKLTRYNNKCTNSIFHPLKYFIVSEWLIIIWKQMEKTGEKDMQSLIIANLDVWKLKKKEIAKRKKEKEKKFSKF